MFYKLSKYIALVFLFGASPLFGNSTAPDPFFPMQWSLHNDGTQSIAIEFDKYNKPNQFGKPGVDIGWLESKEEIQTLGKNPVIVAILDTGLDTDPDSLHPDLQGRIHPAPWDFLYNSGNVVDADGHGTQIAGLIGANFDNGIGIAGITPNVVKLLPIRVSAEHTFNFYRFRNKLSSDYAADGLRYAIKNGATVVNMSLTWSKLADTENFRNALSEAIKAGVLVVADAGNESREHATFPCAYDGVLCVGAITNTGEKSIYSNYGGLIDVLAPGDNLISLFPLGLESQIFRTQGYDSFKGTSGAAPEVAGVAATLRSIYPAISTDELKARILASARPTPENGIALYGLVNLKRAIDMKSKVVYLPHFKAVEDPVVDEKTLSVNSTIEIENLWAPAKNFVAQVFVNNRLSGESQSAFVESGRLVSIPWHYAFKSTDESSIVNVRLHISDFSGTEKDFFLKLTTTRAVNNLKLAREISLPGMQPEVWVSNNNGSLSLKTNEEQYDDRNFEVKTYPSDVGPKSFYQVLSSDSQSVTIQVFDPTNDTPANVMTIPGIQKINEILKIDIKGDGQKAWVITGLGQGDPQHVFFQFYFLDQKFQPLWGNGIPSQWRISNFDGQNLVRSYGVPGSWIRDGASLVPCFLDRGFLPNSDGFNTLDVRHYTETNHFIYLEPTTATSNIQNLEVRALDGANFRRQYPNISLLNVSYFDNQMGKVGILAQMDAAVGSPVYLLDVKSVSDFTLRPAGNWNGLSARGKLLEVESLDFSQKELAFAGVIDDLGHNGTLSWANFAGDLSARTDYDYTRPRNPIYNVTSVFDLSQLGHYWFVETGFDLVGFHSGFNSNSQITSQHLPLERDSSYSLEYFRRKLTPVLAGTKANPLPGVLYNDSNFIRKNEIFLTDFNPTANVLERPLRYSLKLPDGCIVVDNFRPAGVQELLAVGLLCQQNSSLTYKVLIP